MAASSLLPIGLMGWMSPERLLEWSRRSSFISFDVLPHKYSGLTYKLIV